MYEDFFGTLRDREGAKDRNNQQGEYFDTLAGRVAGRALRNPEDE